MLLLISPAKTFASDKKLHALHPMTAALFPEETKAIITETLALTPEQLGKSLGLSVKLQTEVYQRLRRFFDEDTPESPALLTYSGMVYKKLAAKSFTSETWQYAEEHLLMTSFVYGLLRPSSGIRPYRMEGTLRLPLTEGGRLFDYWRDRLTPLLLERAQALGGTLLFLASDEMRQLFHWEQVEQQLQVITPSFYVRQPDGALKQIVIYTKMARGTMAHKILSEQIEDPELLKGYAPEGFVFSPADSSQRQWVFVLEEA